MTKHRDLIGQTFGRLTVTEKTGEKKDGVKLWKCQCSCGNPALVKESDLVSGNTRSCGCLQKEAKRKSFPAAYKSFSEKNHKDGTNLSLISSQKSLGGKSKYRGVTYSEEKRRWYAYIKLRGKRHHLGYFGTEEDAHEARLKAEKALFKPIIEKYKSDQDGD